MLWLSCRQGVYALAQKSGGGGEAGGTRVAVRKTCCRGHCRSLQLNSTARTAVPVLITTSTMAAAPSAEPAAGPHALFEALLTGDSARAHSLLQGSAAGQLSHVHGFTTLHAAVLGGCADELPALAAAGAPLDAWLQEGWRATLGDLYDFLERQLWDWFGEEASGAEIAGCTAVAAGCAGQGRVLPWCCQLPATALLLLIGRT